jgi:hypothetical protein
MLQLALQQNSPLPQMAVPHVALSSSATGSLQACCVQKTPGGVQTLQLALQQEVPFGQMTLPHFPGVRSKGGTQTARPSMTSQTRSPIQRTTAQGSFVGGGEGMGLAMAPRAMLRSIKAPRERRFKGDILFGSGWASCSGLSIPWSLRDVGGFI